MTKEEINNGNKLIAEFMGIELVTHAEGSRNETKLWQCYLAKGIPTRDWGWIGEFELLYDKSWDWLMPVVNKCTQIGFRDQDYDSEIYLKWQETFDDHGMFLGSHIDEVFNAVVGLIKYYNNGITNRHP